MEKMTDQERVDATLDGMIELQKKYNTKISSDSQRFVDSNGTVTSLIETVVKINALAIEKKDDKEEDKKEGEASK